MDTVHTHGLPFDPALPGLALALDGGSMRFRIERALFEANVSCTSCRIVRFRYRAGERLIVLYEVDTTSANSGKTDQYLISGRMTGGARTAQEKSDRRLRRKGASRAGAASRTVRLTEPQMRLDVFPEDPRLPALHDYAQESAACTKEIIALGLRDCDPLPVRVEIEPVRYRPGLSATLRCRWTDDDASGSAGIAFIKIVATGDIESEFAGAKRVNAVLVAEHADLHLSLPCAWNEGARVLLYRPAEGRSLEELALSDAATNSVLRRASQALARLHTLDVPGLGDHFARDVREKLARAVQNIRWACPQLGTIARSVENRADAILDCAVRGPMHRDMKPDHIFLSSDRIELIDTGSVCLGNPLVDLGTLLARLDFLALTGRLDASRAQSLISDVCAHYFASVPGHWQAHLPGARAYGGLLVATHVIQGLYPKWHELVREILIRAIDQSGPVGTTKGAGRS